MIFETHAHYDDEAFDKDREKLLETMHSHGIEKIINVGASLKGVRDTVALTESIHLFMEQWGSIRMK